MTVFLKCDDAAGGGSRLILINKYFYVLLVNQPTGDEIGIDS